jgi:ubiquinone/menaquinone biosynthesis C-methylase UbiE
MPSHQEKNAYILGTDLEELNRLGLQHQVWASEAQTGWNNAGFSRGMQILDLGSGPGFCTRELAKIVGWEGKVIAVDKSEVYIKYIQESNKLESLNIETVHSSFDDLNLEANSLDGVYCRWALAWVPNPKEVLEKVLQAVKPGGKVVLHEYHEWMTHQINPSDVYVNKAIQKCYQSFSDAEGDIDIGKHLPSILTGLGCTISGIRPMAKMVQPKDFAWQWPRSFYDTYWPKIQEMGYLSVEELQLAFAELENLEQQADTTLFCPTLIEVIGEKKL